MCQLFINADNQLWTYRTKSLRIDGVVTSIRLEAFFWDVLEEISFRDQMTVNQMITKLYHESLDADHDISNFTSFLRVCASRYLSLIADGDLTRESDTSLSDVSALDILGQESLRRNQRKARFSPSIHRHSIN
jgi:predicted DNA-binding ribbon-helix-helix protein